MNACCHRACLQRASIHRRAAAPMAVLAFALAWLSLPVTSIAQQQEDYSFEMPIEYASLGVGPQPALGHIRLQPGLESARVTRAIIDALQAMQLSIVKPKLDLDDPLPQKKPWETDVVEISAAQVETHNRATPAMALPENRIYGLRYKGVYRIENRELRFTLMPELMHRGVSGKFRKYDKAYSGMYFHGLLKTAMTAELARAHGP